MSSITLGALTVTAEAVGISVELNVDGKPARTKLDSRDAVTLERFLADHRLGELRTGFRVPIHPLLPAVREGFTLTLVHRGRIHDAQPVDLSLTGMLVHAPEVDVKPRSQLVARLILDDYLAKLDAQVVRREGDLMALHFTDSMSQGELSPPTALGPIFTKLEQAFLKQRTGL